ncbi:MAG: methionine--tRNA ligase subunit beta [Chitinophagaceae bacterium]
MLKAHGGFVLPENVPANEFLNIEGEKVSTSRNWAVWVDEYLKDFPEQQDILRYVLCANAPETKDNDFTWKDFQTRNNSELVDKFGNYVNRVLVLTHKLCGGKVPKWHAAIADDADAQLVAEIAASKARIEQSIESYKFRDALFEVIDLARKGNVYLQDKAPWKEASAVEKGALSEDEKTAAQQRIDNCLHLALQLTANLAIVSNPFLPFTAKKICYLLKVVERMLDWENAGKINLLNVGYPMRAPELLFRKIEDAEIDAQVAKLKAGLVASAQAQAQTAAGEVESSPEELKAEISIDDFSKIDLRTGTIVQATAVPKADKLLQLEIDLGFEKRTVLSGIAMHFKPEDIIGQQVVVVANLAPRKMRGIESKGMILMAENAEGKLEFVSPLNAVNNGATVK